jgi:uracil-DNA glycosylase
MIEKIDDILTVVKNCKSCKTITGYKKFPFSSHGTIDSKYMLVSEAPGKDSVSVGKYWIGAGGKILRACLIGTDKELEDIFYITDIVKCWPNDNYENRTLKESEITNCSPFLRREIEALKPKLILSFGLPSSQYLLNKKIIMKDSHGKIFNYNDSTKILVMYHPSGIDRFVKRDIYTSQLKELFIKITEDKIDYIEQIFDKVNDIKVKNLESSQSKSEIINNTFEKFNGVSFILPASGKKITDQDIYRNQLRVTISYKKHFPDKNSDLKFIHNGIRYDIKFTHRGRRSHILKLGSRLMKALNLNSKSSIRIKQIDYMEFEIEKIK